MKMDELDKFKKWVDEERGECMMNFIITTWIMMYRRSRGKAK